MTYKDVYVVSKKYDPIVLIADTKDIALAGLACDARHHNQLAKYTDLQVTERLPNDIRTVVVATVLEACGSLLSTTEYEVRKRMIYSDEGFDYSSWVEYFDAH